MDNHILPKTKTFIFSIFSLAKIFKYEKVMQQMSRM